MIQIKRVYEPLEASDGKRVLVDRLWPRGIAKDSAHIDLWLKDIGPSNELRKWFNHEPAKWESFREKYLDELKDKANMLEEIELLAKNEKVTLLYGAKDEVHNQAVVIQAKLLERLGKV